MWWKTSLQVRGQHFPGDLQISRHLSKRYHMTRTTIGEATSLQGTLSCQQYAIKHTDVPSQTPPMMGHIDLS